MNFMDTFPKIEMKIDEFEMTFYEMESKIFE